MEQISPKSEVYAEDRKWNEILNQRKAEHQQKLKDLEQTNQTELQKAATRFEKEKKEMNQSYEVAISQESKSQAEKLAALRASHEDEIKGVKKEHEQDFERISKREQMRIDNYKKKQEENLQKLHDKMINVEENLKKPT